METLKRGRLEPQEIVDVAAESARPIAALARRLAADTGPADLTAALQSEAGAVMVTALPIGLVRAIHRYANHGSPHNVLLVRGLVIDGPALQASPGTVTPTALGETAQMNMLTLLGVMSLLGEPFTFASLYQGRLVQHVTPVPGQEDAQTSESSDSFLDWHVEDAFTGDRCDYFGLLCLRGDPAATTLSSAVRQTQLEPRYNRLLRQPRFLVQPDFAHGTDAAGPLEAISVLEGPDEDPEICYDAIYQRPADPGDTEAAAALQQLRTALDEAAIGCTLTAGDLLIIDNRRVVHARTCFPPRFDGTDRWLTRVMTCASRPVHRRRGACRALR